MFRNAFWAYIGLYRLSLQKIELFPLPQKEIAPRKPVPAKSSPLLQKKCAVKVLRTPTLPGKNMWGQGLAFKSVIKLIYSGFQLAWITTAQIYTSSWKISCVVLHVKQLECHANRVYFLVSQVRCVILANQRRSPASDSSAKLAIYWKFVGGHRSLRRRRKLASREGKGINISNRL